MGLDSPDTFPDFDYALVTSGPRKYKDAAGVP